MGTIVEFIRRAGSVLASIVTFKNNSRETWMSYTRTDGKQIDFVLVHLPNVSGDTFSIPHLALSSTRLKNNPNFTPHAMLNLSMEEGRLLRDFLNRPEISSWLDEEEA